MDTRTSPATITYNVEYYVLGHLAKFVVPGAHRIDSNTFNTDGIEDDLLRELEGCLLQLHSTFPIGSDLRMEVNTNLVWASRSPESGPPDR